jgi:hypothetical protein
MPTSNAKSLLIIIVLMLQATSWAAPANPCQPVHDAYSKMLSTPHKNVETNSGAMNVTKAFGIITSEEFDDSCKYLRDESLDGELMAVYSEVFKSKSGRADGMLWISKKDNIVVRQDVDANMGAQGKGHQSIRFDYSKK